MRRLLMAMALVLYVGCWTNVMQGQTARPVYTREYSDKALVKKAKKWMKMGEWRNGFTKARPHCSVNAVDFYQQYQRNPEAWSRMFAFLQETDLLAVPKGKTPIPGTNLVLNVQDSKNEPLDKRRSESHYKGIDFQYCVKGTERFGIIDHTTSVPNDKYKKDVIHYDYDKSRAKFYDSKPDEFFIFFPGDWHIAKVANDTDDQDIRVVVVKVEYVE
ncbi:MAG: YhcH/YjgK/YiaL family protein [Prevotella sp.]|nr:YhcH/YjgK/YiaL family protein [Prevotella sp.]